MPKGQKKEEPAQTPSDDTAVTDAMLDAASETDEPTVELPVEDERISVEPMEEPVEGDPGELELDPGEPDDTHAERSQLGKKVAATHRRLDDMENNMSGFMDEMRTLMYMRDAEQPGKQGGTPRHPMMDDFDDAPAETPDEYITMKTSDGYDVQVPRNEFSKVWRSEAENFQKERTQESVKRQQRYEGLYMNTTSQLTDEIKEQDPELAEAVFQLTTDNQKVNPYNQNLSQGRDPVSDARVNVARAEAGLMRKRLAEGRPTGDKVINLKQDQPIGPLGPTAASKAAPARTMAVQLDPYAKDLVADMEKRGIEVDVEEALTGDMPSYLGGR